MAVCASCEQKIPAFPKESYVIIQGLKNTAQYNGKRAKIRLSALSYQILF
jgi:hypothetical protein